MFLPFLLEVIGYSSDVLHYLKTSLSKFCFFSIVRAKFVSLCCKTYGLKLSIILTNRLFKFGAVRLFICLQINIGFE